MTQNDPYDLSRPSLPVAYPMLLLEILQERDLAHEQAARDSGIDARVLAQPDGRITLIQWSRLALEAIRLTGDEGLGIEYGLRLRPSAHGFLGYAAMTASTLREAIDLSTRYFQMRLPSYRLHFAEEGKLAVLELAEVHPIPVLRSFFFECLLVGLLQLPQTFAGECNAELELWFDWPEPAYFPNYRDRLPRARFSRPANQLRFPNAYLEQSPVLADSVAHRQALAQVELEYATVRPDERNLAARVRAELVLTQTGYPNVQAVAARLCMSTRTLRRQLGAEGTSYQVLRDAARQRDARQLLESSRLDIQGIATRLGFENPPSFTRAFKLWTGVTPSAYRKTLGDMRGAPNRNADCS